MRASLKIFFVALVALYSTSMAMAQCVKLQAGDVKNLHSTAATLTAIITNTCVDNPVSWTSEGLLSFNVAGVNTGSSYFVVTPDHKTAAVSIQVSGLTPGTNYLFRPEAWVGAFAGSYRVDSDEASSFTTLADGAPYIASPDTWVPTVPIGSLGEVAGEGLNPSTQAFVNNAPVPTIVRSARQLAFQVPVDMVPETEIALTVRNGDLTSNVASLRTVATLPDILGITDDQWRANSSQSPAAIGSDGTTSLVLIATGLGAVVNQPPTGTTAVGVSSTMITNPSIYFNGQPAQILFSGLMPGQIGVYQINLRAKVDRTSLPANGYVPATLITAEGTSVFFVVYVR